MPDEDIPLPPPPRWYTNHQPPARAPATTATVAAPIGSATTARHQQPTTDQPTPTGAPVEEAQLVSTAAGHRDGTYTHDELTVDDSDQATGTDPARPHAAASARSPATDPVLGPDLSMRAAARTAGTALFGPDLLRSGPGWPFGARARARRARNQALAEEARRRRARLRQALHASSRPTGTTSRGPWVPVPASRHAAVIACLAATVVVMLALVWWFGGPEPTGAPPPAVAAAPTGAARPTTPFPAMTPSSPAPTPDPSSPPAPIPSDGVAAQPPPPPRSGTDPDEVMVVDAPAGDPGPRELASPEAAMQAWLARLCPYSHHEAFGTPEQRARPAMTSNGWAQIDPADDERVRASWDDVVAAREVARCAAPTAAVSPEAPRSDTSAVVIGEIQQVITAGSGARWVETLSHTRIVLRGDDGLWRGDIATAGG